MKYTLYIGTNRYSLSTEDDILKLSPGNFEYQHKILIGNTDILKSVQVAYKKLFQKAIDKYNKNNPKKEIKSYYCKINESQKQSLAVGVLIKINEKNYKNLDEEKLIDLFLNQVKVIKKIIKNFHIVSVILYFEKKFLTLRIIGIPYVKDKTNELEVRVSKSSCFTREKVEELRLNLQIQANKNFLKFFVTKTKVIVTKNNIDIKQLKLFENYRENRV